MKNVLLAILAGIMWFSLVKPAGADVLPFEKSEYKARRAKLMEKIPDGIAIFLGSLAPPQNNEMKYLCGVVVPRTILTNPPTRVIVAL